MTKLRVFVFRTMFAASFALISDLPAQTPPADLLEQALLLDAGTTGPRNPEAAARLYKSAAEAGDAVAHLRLGYMYEVGDGVDQSYVEARAHYQAAVDADLAPARLRLAICHLEGWGGPVDRTRFVEELRLAAESDYAPAQTILSSMYFVGFVVKADAEEGLKWLERAAASDDSDAQHRLGARIERLRRANLPSDLELARKWYQLAAEQEYYAAMRATARSFLEGNPKERSWQTARAWLELATEQGDDEASFTLAVNELARADSPSRDVEQAERWLQIASTRGNSRATEVLQLASGGQSLADAIRYVLRVPYEERYIRIATAKASMDKPTHPPVIYRIVNPVYPETLRLFEVTGKVKVEFIVDTTGRVRSAKVVETDHPLFGERAVEATLQWRFHPARRNGRLVNVRMQVPVEFQIKTEQIADMDTFLRRAVDYAQRLGGQVAADAVRLRMAEPLQRLPEPRTSEGVPTPGMQALVLLVLDSNGQPIRGHVLRSTPASLGASLLEIGLAHRYKPLIENGANVPSNVILSFAVRPPAEANK